MSFIPTNQPPAYFLNLSSYFFSKHIKVDTKQHLILMIILKYMYSYNKFKTVFNRT